MCLRDPAQSPLDETTAGVTPEDDPRGRQALLERRTRRKLGAEARPEFVRVEVEDCELAQAAVDRERRRAVGHRAAARGALDLGRGPLDVGAELVARLFVHARVRVTVAGRLMSAPDDLRNELAMVRDGHPEQEEGRPSAELVEEIEQRRRLAFERGVGRVPVCEAEPPVHDLVPVFEVDREQQPRLVHAGDCRRKAGV